MISDYQRGTSRVFATALPQRLVLLLLQPDPNTKLSNMLPSPLRAKNQIYAPLLAVLLVACGQSSDSTQIVGGTGRGTVVGSGGSIAPGGSDQGAASQIGGTTGVGGKSEIGGVMASGGAVTKTGTHSAAGGDTESNVPPTGGITGIGGSSAVGGSSTVGGTSASSASAAGGTSTGGRASSIGGTSSGGAGATGGRVGLGGAGTGGTGAGGAQTGGASTGGSTVTGGTVGFSPCPTNGDPCKVLPLGDSITLGTNYGGGYRIKLFAHAIAEQRNLTFVGYDTANTPTAAALTALGSASSKYVNKHEGHFAWTIQQDDDLVTGVSKASQDGVNYSGKKVVADAQPHIVLVHLGTNDMQVQPSGATDRLAKLLDHVVSDVPNALVVVASIIPLPSQASNVTAFNQAIPGIVKQRADAGKHVIYVDQYAGFTGKTGLMDSVHPYEAGYEQMAVVWYAAIKPYLH